MIPLYKPYMPESLSEIDNILHSGALAYGKWGVEFERSIKDFIGCSNEVVAVNSYTSALQVMLCAAGIGPGDEIIASPMCCLASTQPAAALGAKFIWADIDSAHGTLDPDDVEKKISPRTKLIMHNHFCGYPGHIDEINAIGKRHGILVADDCIEAFGAEYKGRKLGNTGTDITTFSFQTVRLPNAIDGGAVIFKDSDQYRRALQVRDFGIARSAFRDSLGEINPHCDIARIGFGATINEIFSYIGFVQMKEITRLLDIQRQNAAMWQQLLATHPSVAALPAAAQTQPSYWVFGVLSDDKRETIKRFRELGLYASGVHLPNYYYSVFGERSRLKGVEEFYSRFLAVPSGWWVNAAEISNLYTAK